MRGSAVVLLWVILTACAHTLPPPAVRYSTAPWFGQQAGEDGFCHGAFFVYAQGGRELHLEADGEDHGVGTSWTFYRDIREGTRLTKHFTLSDLSGEVVSEKSVTIRCYWRRPRG